MSEKVFKEVDSHWRMFVWEMLRQKLKEEALDLYIMEINKGKNKNDLIRLAMEAKNLAQEFTSIYHKEHKGGEESFEENYSWVRIGTGQSAKCNNPSFKE
mmetsp:Transcript_15994/g.24805  ORF Transcript_15994/g.24805 Transcript_15994/m.24805 type:complete len:100 (-) Transcript_15994:264-563(-)|eukprot:CAMPEP_0170509220 /NCGR_PEP_ID=MMETSP0208-20121228/64799_1 /TAXON_ID=197538 /ORGANISM="Strombidium inclinatum, Strain S3" /LENGTH=99 /DNA_ID=CAMNT_0010792529 /DNA_START=494 /DNA_END=793 /DNA_ORIENTATION=-